ncbi:hypothetical protein OS493_012599 [Desmophyllum pertusum]|uniref:DUF4834 family protein n=1 Tax=Desmophyllum pertusum TaxID=174260 RepID=A0A9W9ZEC7_9CNID|nr:hypothetical protein OS493_012599 [Desmophyllum pertusum]
MNPIFLFLALSFIAKMLQKIWDWASSYGAAARQRTVRQETTMARHGTLPEFMYQRQYEISEKPVSIAFDEQGNTADVATENESEEDEADGSDEF